eukprot:CAMPEP_0198513414 /NCGR_PEP_ID=MMETSP1462-20131121/16046_1 /TAXON_ID=1333877 /ORGANISM="Brandtodinium nutriculum, Strain RCC3387" /LENGTH=41 /DNA_ID= /DNA_START= /DNA_END= /DNA_ORIENTATION=
MTRAALASLRPAARGTKAIDMSLEFSSLPKAGSATIASQSS